MVLEKRSPIKSILLYTFLIFMALICIVPFYMMIINSTRSNVDVCQGIWLTPGDQLLVNYAVIQSKVNLWHGFFNSVIIAVPAVLLSAFFSALTAYGFAKFKFKGSNVLFFIILGTMMVPQQLGLIGFYNLMSKLGLIDSYLPLIVPNIANAAMVFFIKSYIESSIPDSLIEAGLIDGASEFYIFNRIVIPLAMPSIATMSIFTFIYKWNDLINPLVLLNSPSKFTMPILISSIKGQYETNYGAIYLAIAMSVTPIITVVIIFSKQLISGLTVGAVKG